MIKAIVPVEIKIIEAQFGSSPEEYTILLGMKHQIEYFMENCGNIKLPPSLLAAIDITYDELRKIKFVKEVPK